MPAPETLEHQGHKLPESHTPQVLYDRLVQSDGSIAKVFDRDKGLLLDVLALAAWSPLLATTLEQNPDYLTWLQRERLDTRVRSREDLGESLARFALTHSTLDPHDAFARFRRRELLRIYLHDLRRAHTVAETTEELSNLADAILAYALRLSRQRLDNRFGAPQRMDSEGRIAATEFCVVALGKLGSRELNYASDIDLMFLFSHEGLTSGGSRGQVTNREYYVKLAENILRLVSEPTGEGAAYRTDVRLRPHGREGTLACTLDEAVRYYETSGQDWELQTLIRARSAAGSDRLFSRFAASVVDRIYRQDVSVALALANVRLAKQKIDIQRERSEKGFNVKLGRGGIREIEFIAQALQLAFGGRDPWLRAPHTLISLGRLADRGLITETEHSHLSEGYQFWRCLEHRLQMEHGLQTHSVPKDRQRRELIARRMAFSGNNPASDLEAAMTRHATNVRAVFERVFAASGAEAVAEQHKAHPSHAAGGPPDPDAATALKAASIFIKHLDSASTEKLGSYKDGVIQLATLLHRTAESSVNVRRSLSFTARIARSLDKETLPDAVTLSELQSVLQICSVSDVFGEMIASRPVLIHAIEAQVETIRGRDYASELRTVLSKQNSFRGELDALRRRWSEALVEIAARDAGRDMGLDDVNQALTNLAAASIDAALFIARRELERRYGPLAAEPRVAVLGLGRLGSGGMDYGSDLDVIVIHDSAAPSPVAELTHTAAYARLVELMIAALSNVTREGSLYRVDLRLRPDGQKGPIVSSSESFLSYLEQRADVWEWLAYVKLRAVAGDRGFGQTVESDARRCIHALASEIDHSELLAETRRVRARLEKEKASWRSARINIKHGAGGMLDIYFAVRYLQLRDNVPDDDRERTTLGMLKRLHAAGSIDDQIFKGFYEGYRLLRSVDHETRLIIGRSATLRVEAHPAVSDIAKRLGYETADTLSAQLRARMGGIRTAYEQVLRLESK